MKIDDRRQQTGDQKEAKEKIKHDPAINSFAQE
jgi:hypothetical protein